MKLANTLKSLPILVFTFIVLISEAQILPNVYTTIDEDVINQITIDDNYLVYTVYRENPAEFIKTVGGFYTIKDGEIEVPLDFNSNYKNDTLLKVLWPYDVKNGLKITIDGKVMNFLSDEQKTQDLDGNWLFTGRINEQGEESRRDTNIPRKTMKFLLNGHFQWVAYNTETMEFSGTGGGTYTANENIYEENIQFFSKDNSRVGNSLRFNYNIKNGEWYHSGKSSKGDPLNEIWVKR